MAIGHNLEQQLRALAKEIEDATALREELVVKAWKRGGGIREIADLAGLSHPGVSKMLDRLGVRRPLTQSPEDMARYERERRGER